MSDLISTSEAAELMGLTDSMVRRHVRDGRLRAISAGGMYLIRRGDAKAFRRMPRGPRPKKPKDKHLGAIR